LAEMIETATKVLTVLPKQCVKLQLKVLCRVSPSLLFMTDQILSLFIPFSIVSNKEFNRALIYLTSYLMVSEVNILGINKVTQVEW
jgi:hypothetical protein